MGNPVPPTPPEIIPDKWYSVTFKSYRIDFEEPENACDEDRLLDTSCHGVIGQDIIDFFDNGGNCELDNRVIPWWDNSTQKITYLTGPYETEDEAKDACPEDL